MAALLSLTHTSKSYWRGPHETVVLDDVSLDVRAGEMIAIWGRRGAGKTTLLKVAAGLEPPDRGIVSFQGRDVRSRRPGLGHLLGTSIGWVQRSGPLSEGMLAIEYVALPLLGRVSRREALRRASASLGQVGVRDCARSGWSSLTDGERTLVCIAHALVREPRLLIADDPTANLDILQREEVIALLAAAAEQRGLGVLMTVPDMPEMLGAHRVGSLSEGGLILSQDDDGENVIDFPGKQRSL
ncbi:MAG TPA: ATP-binding cassette domain-containing protein [Solirubrobacteraceae bacterium]|nr:ATP-binding cassette domain-containing protein [Solirubrobacteraceae bacterium]